MYDVHGDIGVEELMTSGFVVWLGIHLILHKWRCLSGKRFGRGVEYVVLDVSDLDSEPWGG